MASRMTPQEERDYRVALNHQLTEWVNGRSTHLPPPYGECCPDFSCCYPDMMMPSGERVAYALKHLGEYPSDSRN